MLPQPNDDLAVKFGIFSTRQALGAGHSRADVLRHLRSARWRSVDRGVLVASEREPSEVDDLVLALLVGGPETVLCLRSAARVHGWDVIHPPTTPELMVGTLPQRRKTSPVRPRFVRRTLSELDVAVLGVVRVTRAARTAVDLAADLDTVDAVVAVDSALRLHAVTMDELASELRSRPKMRGRAKACIALDLISPLSGSPRESEIRVRIALAGLEAPVEQLEIFDGELFIGRADFAWPRLRLILEIDGFTYHSSQESLQNDHDRQRALEDAHWRVLRFTGNDVLERPEEILAALRRAGVRAISSRNRSRRPT